MGQSLEEFIDGKQKFLKLQENQEFEGYMIGYKVIPDKFKIGDDPTATTVLWKFQTLKGKEIEFTCGNLTAVRGLSVLQKGQAFKIVKKGAGPKTTYEVTALPKNMDDEPPF